VLAETRQRDAIDSGRATAPLRAAADAIRISTDHVAIADVVGTIERIARARQPGYHEAPR